MRRTGGRAAGRAVGQTGGRADGRTAGRPDSRADGLVAVAVAVNFASPPRSVPLIKVLTPCVCD